MTDFTTRLRASAPTTQTTLAHERSRSPLPIASLTTHLLSASGFLARQSRILPLLTREPLLRKHRQQHLSRPARYALGLARAKLLRRLGRHHAWSPDDYATAEYLVDEMSPYHLQLSMFATTVREQGDDKQRSEWVPRIERWEVIGCYAQTEMGHGSNVRGLECVARYDVGRREFVLHSPTLTASKWWNGSLGRTATHAVVVAQLVLPREAQLEAEELPKAASAGYVTLGPHAFIVQIRDLHTHQPLPGVVVGDIGPKHGYASMDNGYLLFSSFRVPHAALLARYSSVDAGTGRYHRPTNPAVVYGSLTSVRAHIIMHARLVLARAVTIAVRYTAVRRQFGENKGAETQVLDYASVQWRVLPLVARVYALHYTGRHVSALYASSRARIEGSQDYSLLAGLHAQSSALKSQCTEYAANGIETCRRACGGHGFGGYSGFVPLNADYLSKVTVEGDNWMITMQAGRWLVKRCEGVAGELSKARWDERKLEGGEWVDGEIARVMALQRSGMRVKTRCQVLKSSKAIVDAFQRRAAGMAVDVWRKMKAGKKEQDVQVEMHHLSNAFAQALLVRNFWQALQVEGDEAPPQGAKEVLHSLFRLYGLHTLHAHAVSFLILSPAVITLADVAKVPDELQKLMTGVRRHAVPLADAWAIPDYLLDSALGNEKGEVYERMWDWAHKQNPLNKVTADPWYWHEQVVQGEGKYVMPWSEGEGRRAKL